MALVRMTEKKLAANRANAQKSTGPRTPEGKARTAQNACKHHLYSRTHTIPPEWHARIVPRVVQATAEFAHDQDLRDLQARWLYLELWAIELDTLADLYFNDILARCHNDYYQALYQWLRQETLYRVIHKRRMHIHFRAIKAERAIRRYRPAPALPFHLPKTMSAGVGQASWPVNPAAENPPSTVPTHISFKTNPLPTPPQATPGSPTPKIPPRKGPPPTPT